MNALIVKISGLFVFEVKLVFLPQQKGEGGLLVIVSVLLNVGNHALNEVRLLSIDPGSRIFYIGEVNMEVVIGGLAGRLGGLRGSAGYLNGQAGLELDLYQFSSSLYLYPVPQQISVKTSAVKQVLHSLHIQGHYVSKSRDSDRKKSHTAH